MLSRNPSDLLAEIRAAEDLRKRVLANTTTLIKRYVGNWYRSDSRSRPRPENMLFAFVATMVPQIVFDNPQVKVKAKRSQSHADIAKFMQMGLNGWVEDVELRSELEALAYDMLFAYGVAKVGLEERPDHDGGHANGVMGAFNMEALMPFLVRLSPANFFLDSQCTRVQNARLQGHMFQRDLEDLQQDERFDQAIVGRLTADDEKAIGKTASERAFPSGGATSEALQQRGRVTLYELYFPETREIGTLSLMHDGTGEWIRPLQKYYGPDEGPYVFFGVYCVPDQPYPLSPIAAMAEQDAELNAHAAAAAKEAATGKNLVLVDANHPEAAQAIREAPTNGVLTIKGMNGSNIVPVAVGGTTEQRIAYLNLLLQRTDRVAGQSEAARGKAQGVTATEASLANSNSDVRDEFVHMKFAESVAAGLYRVGWYFWNDPAVVSVVSMEDPATGMEIEGVFLGGQQGGGDEGSDWGQFNLQIDPLSMRRIDPMQQQQQASQALELALMILPVIPSIPYANWSAILDLAGDAANLPDFARLILNGQGMAMLQAAQMGMPVAPMPMGMGAEPGGGMVPGAMQPAGGRRSAGPGQGPSGATGMSKGAGAGPGGSSSFASPGSTRAA